MAALSTSAVTNDDVDADFAWSRTSLQQSQYKSSRRRGTYAMVMVMGDTMESSGLSSGHFRSAPLLMSAGAVDRPSHSDTSFLSPRMLPRMWTDSDMQCFALCLARPGLHLRHCVLRTRHICVGHRVCRRRVECAWADTLWAGCGSIRIRLSRLEPHNVALITLIDK
jgi:hypothetical protein